MATLQLKNITENLKKKKHWMISTTIEETQESVSLKIHQLRLSSLRNRKKIKINGQSPVR